jgi:hypothetical protein
MRAAEIDTQLKQRPFVPFRMHFSDGSHYDVRHPEMMLVAQRALALTVYERPGAKLPERLVLCDPMHVTRLEQIDGDDTRS